MLDVQIKTVNVTLTAGASQTVNITAPTGRFALSTGWTCAENPNAIGLFSGSRPLSSTVWEFTFNGYTFEGTATVQIYMVHASTTLLGLPL